MLAPNVSVSRPKERAALRKVTFGNEQTSRGKLQRLLFPQGGTLRPPPGLPLSNVQARNAP
jgi:hypothetical protein